MSFIAGAGVLDSTKGINKFPLDALHSRNFSHSRSCRAIPRIEASRERKPMKSIQ